jgi:two-component system NtrC family sensor kinase
LITVLPFRRSLTARLISSYLVILGIGGLVTSFVGSWIVSTTIMREAQRSVDRDLATARMVYLERLRSLERAVELAASGVTVQQYVGANDFASLSAYLNRICVRSGFDFLGLTGADGRVVLRVPTASRAGDGVKPALSVVDGALAGRLAAGTEIMTAAELERESPELRSRARLTLVPTPRAAPPPGTELTSGMALVAAAPLRPSGGALYGGVLLNRNHTIVDSVQQIVVRGDPGDQPTSVTIFQNDVRIATTLRTGSGGRAVGTRVSAEVREAVLDGGEAWRGRAFVISDWYISRYEPIRDFSGRIAGILYVGVPERAYTSIRDRVILSFFAIATAGFLFIIGITYYMTRSITQPIARLVGATRNIAAGRFDEPVQPNAVGEIAILADSFNTMLKSLRQMKGDLQEWGHTLEEKVRQRTDELVSMQARVAQSERLASVGLLAAGVAHEINNPLGGILALTALALEDLPPGDPNRENLEEVLKQAQRCRDTVRHLLDFSRQSRLVTEPADVNRIVEGALALVVQQAPFFNITVVKRLAAGLPPVPADKSQLQQVFLNIVINAVQAMEEKGTLTISSRLRDGSVEVLIADTGPGIAAGQVDRIFDPFFTTKESGQGTGLGLSIAYGIMRKHNGSIAVESVPGRGSTFIVRLPALSDVPRADASPASPVSVE